MTVGEKQVGFFKEMTVDSNKLALLKRMRDRMKWLSILQSLCWIVIIIVLFIIMTLAVTCSTTTSLIFKHELKDLKTIHLNTIQCYTCSPMPHEVLKIICRYTVFVVCQNNRESEQNKWLRFEQNLISLTFTKYDCHIYAFVFQILNMNKHK